MLLACIFLCCVLSAFADKHNKENPSEKAVSEMLFERLQALEEYAKQREKKINELDTKLRRQQSQLKKMMAEVQKTILNGSHCKDSKLVKEATKENKQDGSEMDPGLSRGTRSTTPHVAFSAYLDFRMTHVTIDQIIRFDRTILNHGNAYNTATGTFTCPVSGVYLFSYMVNTFVKARQLVVELVLDGINESDGTSDPFHNLQEAQGGNTVILHCNKGQSVWLAAYNTNDTEVDGRENYRFSTLSGVLLYES